MVVRGAHALARQANGGTLTWCLFRAARARASARSPRVSIRDGHAGTSSSVSGIRSGRGGVHAPGPGPLVACAVKLHVHVGVPAPEDAIRPCSGLRRHTTILLALSGNSPFCRGRGSGFAPVLAACDGTDTRLIDPGAHCLVPVRELLDALVAKCRPKRSRSDAPPRSSRCRNSRSRGADRRRAFVAQDTSLKHLGASLAKQFFSERLAATATPMT